MDVYVLDTSLLLGGREPPRGRWVTTPEAAAEVRPGGRDARRFAYWLEAGLEVRTAEAASRERVVAVAAKAGNLARLSAADLSLAALALELAQAGTAARLLTDDHTLLDVCLRLGVPTRSVNGPGIRSTLDFRPRCSGCGRWFGPGAPPRGECPVCGSPVVDKPWREGGRTAPAGE